jgi:hypothetical protein
MEIVELKKKYNIALKRNKKAEEYLKVHTIEECSKEIEVKGVKTGKTTFDLFNEVVAELSGLAIEIETVTDRRMTHDEKLNGFKLGGE